MTTRPTTGTTLPPRRGRRGAHAAAGALAVVAGLALLGLPAVAAPGAGAAGSAGPSGPPSAAPSFIPNAGPHGVYGGPVAGGGPTYKPYAGILRTSAGSDWQHTLQVLSDLRADPPPVPLVVLLGGSAARECNVSDSLWSLQVSRHGVPIVVACNMASKHRTFGQDLQIIQALPAKVQTLVFIGINVGRFTNGSAVPPLNLPKPSWITHPEPYNQHHYSVVKIFNRATKRWLVRDWMNTRYPVFNARYGYNITELARLVTTCKARGLHPVLLDLPRDMPDISHSLDAPFARYHGGCKAIARRYNVPFVDFNSQCHYRSGDFFDLWHLVQPGRDKYQRLLSNATIRCLQRFGVDGGMGVTIPEVGATAPVPEPATPAPAPVASAATP